ncbi:endonuclease/exonuclease/phosphatase family protein [Streptomyces goshikiensis]|uniref:endonuclease/exonuclease/phosphatase family protein n=1 Tax=Streptomyces goshikiensis TaxID=1942 RepID=UPI00364BA8CC
MISMMATWLAIPVAPAEAAVRDHIAVTWNMQGATSGGQSNWADQVRAMLTVQGADVVALQEAGSVPGSAAGNPLRTFTYQTAAGVNYQVREYLWRGSSSRGTNYYVYHMQTDPNGNRVNLAIVTRQRASTVHILPPVGSRAMFGVELGDGSVFWTAHAGAHVGNDAARIVAAVRTEMIALNRPSWAVLADFNRSPSQLVADPAWPGNTVRVVSSGSQTQRSGGELDYMVTSDFTATYRAAQLGGPLSDHHPVTFGRNLRAAADVPEMLTSGRWKQQILCASASDDSVWLRDLEGENGYCQWLQYPVGNDHFLLYNLGKDKVMAYEGGDGGPVVMEDYSAAGRNQQYFSWGGKEEWDAYALQSYYDSGQNVDAKATGSDTPRTGPIHTRGWRHGDQMELTWNKRSEELVVSSPFPDHNLCASDADNLVWLKDQASSDADCQWFQVGGDDKFTLYNPANGKVMAYEGGDGGPVVMEDYSAAGRNQQNFSWGGKEEWDAYALQSYYDSGQNVDAKATNSDTPRTDAVHTRGWRHGFQQELTWKTAQ